MADEARAVPEGVEGAWLREARGHRIAVLLSGATIVGELLASDRECLLVQPRGERQPVVIYKRAVATLTRMDG